MMKGIDFQLYHALSGLKNSLYPLPRALPWASIFDPFGVLYLFKKTYHSFCHILGLHPDRTNTLAETKIKAVFSTLPYFGLIV